MCRFSKTGLSMFAIVGVLVFFSPLDTNHAFGQERMVPSKVKSPLPQKVVATEAAISKIAPGPGNPCTGYRFVGYSQSSTTGGSGGGLRGMNARCSARFGANARMCTTLEFLSSSPHDQSVPYAWIQPHLVAVYWNSKNGVPVFVDYSGSYSFSTMREMTCLDWNHGPTAQNTYGLVVDTSTYLISTDRCTRAKPVACCDYR